MSEPNTPPARIAIPEATARVAQITIGGGVTIEHGLFAMDRAGLGILLIVDENNVLQATLTDGDFRRAILNHVSLAEPCISVANREPVVAPFDASPAETLHLMDHGCGFVIHHVPIVDNKRRPIAVILRRDLITEDNLDVQAMVMAGGFGMRLRPLTDHLPKPMLPVGGRPLMEHLLEQLKRTGIKRVNVATHYLGEKITDYFGDGSSMGLTIDYVMEDRPLGTAGALNLLKKTEETLLVLNGDIVTRVDFRAMLAFHKEHGAGLTVGVRRHEVTIPFGVVETEGPFIRGMREKPTVRSIVSAGIYLLEPRIFSYIEDADRLDMPDLIMRLVESDEVVVSFPIVEYWMDVGQREDYERAQSDMSPGAARES